MQPLKSLTIGLRFLFCLALFTSTLPADAQSTHPSLRISQIYGGGGNNDATLHSDFIELFNAGPDPVNLTGWSIQYAAKESRNWAVTELGTVTIGGFGYLLVRQAAGDGGSDAGTALETPDVVGDSNLSASEGKVALVAGTTPIIGLSDGAVVDFVGYGNANEYELAPALKLSNTAAALRLVGGCTDQNHNATDFERLPPAPRNQSAPPNPCVLAAAAPPTDPPAPPIEPLTTTLSGPELGPDNVTSTIDIPDVTVPDITAPVTATATTGELPPATMPQPAGEEATVTATATPISLPLPETPTETPTATASGTELPLPTDTPLPTLTATIPPSALQPLATPPPHLLITEFLADPKAVKDEEGEWLELYNADTVAVNLLGWTVADLDNDRHTLALELWIQPGQYLVLARNSDTALNGGVTAAYVYQSLSLANSADELLLLAPDGAEIDRVMWGDGTALPVKAGASAQRLTLESSSLWETSQEAWPGSLGDKGTPGNAYQPPLPTPTATPSPVATPSSTWPIATAPGPLQIDEVLYSGSADEFIVLQNTSTASLDLTGWLVGDAETPGKSEGIYALPPDTILAAGALLVLARDGSAFHNRWGRLAHAEFAGTDPETPDLARRRDLAKGELALNDNGDEVLLFNPAGEVADAVAFEEGNYSILQLTGILKTPTDYALHSVPAARFPTVPEVRQRFLYAPSDPFVAITLPTPLPQASPRLDDGLVAAWGSLGAQSIFSRDGAAPPHYLLAAAAAQGLHFLAVADPLYVQPWQPATPPVALPAWRWSGEDDVTAIVYNTQPQIIGDPTGLLTYLDNSGSIAQWQKNTPPVHSRITALAADTVSAPGALATLYNAWFAAAAPLLPAGNASPDLPGTVAPTNRYTGLAVAALEVAALQDALINHRGWLTSRPGLWLTLQAQLPDDSRHWMGSTLTAANEIILDVDYGDNSGEVAGVAIWQDDKPIQQLATPLAGGRWRVTLAAVPNSFLYAVATQADGDFAVTAPLYVLPTADGEAVVFNEILPAPGADHNGDGAINSDDEYIELYNPGDDPISLVGWQLSDAAGDASVSRRFTFGPGRFVGGHGWLLLRRSETRINLNNADDYVRLLNPAGAEIDQLGWAQSPRQGRSLSRLPDGGTWQEGAATPGQSNKAVGGSEDEEPDNDDDDDADKHDDASDEPPPVQLDPTHGQAGGAPASIAQSKLAGLEKWVEFRAVVTAPPGLYNATIYVADPAPDYTMGPLAGIGVNIYLRNGEFPPLAEGDRVLVRGVWRSFRGEMELQLDTIEQLRRLESGAPLQPLPVTVAEIGESVEGRLVTFTGSVSGWQGDSIFLIDPTRPDIEAVRVTVRSSLDWRRPYVNRGERWQVTGIVSQFAREAPWNGGYRVLVRYKADLVELRE